MSDVLRYREGLFGRKIELHIAPEGLTLVGQSGPGTVEFAPLADVREVSVEPGGRTAELRIGFGESRPSWSLPKMPAGTAEWGAALIGEIRSVLDKQGRPEYTQPLPIAGIGPESGRIAAMADGRAAVDLVDFFLMQGVLHGSSDVHFDPYADSIVVRFRTDGILHDVAKLDIGLKRQLTSRLKVVSRLATYKKSVAQEGRAAIRMRDRTVDFRFSAIPTIHGEKIAVRVFDPATSIFTIDRLGMSPEMLAGFEAMLLQPQGTILLTGPASSGKTTTMYAALGYLRENRRNLSSIATVEDPVEYDLKIMNQTQVNTASGLTFANALRTVLRQDPEVIMIGEIRDSETADIAVQAGLTGHMILSTVHARSAAGVLLRLADLGVEPYLLASSVSAVLSQRLVRAVCSSCAKEYVPTDEERTKFRLRGDDRFVTGSGCTNCGNTGYHGRTGIFQLLPIGDDMRELVLRRASLGELDGQVDRDGVKAMLHDGLEKARAGVTTLDELTRVLG